MKRSIVHYHKSRSLSGGIIEHKSILTKLDDNYYLVKPYSKNEEGEWKFLLHKSNPRNYFYSDSAKEVSGMVKRTDSVDTYFNYLIEYEGYDEYSEEDNQ